MYIIDGIAYAGEVSRQLEVTDFKILDVMHMLIKFSSGEERIFDATVLLKYPVYRRLLEPDVFATAAIEDGVLVWLEGEIDIGTETLYAKSLPRGEGIRGLRVEGLRGETRGEE